MQNLPTMIGIESFAMSYHIIVPNYVPKRYNYDNKKIRRIPRERRILMRKRSKLKAQYLKATLPTKSLRIREKLLNIEKQLQRSYRNLAESDEFKAIQAIKTNSKYFYSYAKKKSKIKTKIGPLEYAKKQYESDSAKMAEILQAQYVYVFAKPRQETGNLDSIIEPDISLSDIIFNEQDIENAIDELSNTSAAGPHGFPAVFLKKCKKYLSKPLYIIWRTCLDHGVTPDILCLSFIVPIHKGGGGEGGGSVSCFQLSSSGTYFTPNKKF